MTDWIMAIIALSAAVCSIGVIAWFVPDVDLMIVIAIVSAMAAWDFYIHLRRDPDQNGPD